MLQSVTLSAGVPVKYYERGAFFRIMEASAALTVRYFFEGRLIAESDGVKAGYAENFESGGFDSFELESAGGQTVQFAARLSSSVQYDVAPTGAVTVGNFPATGFDASTHWAIAVTVTSGLKLAANASRKYLLVQNQHATAVVYIRFGSAATIGSGIRLLPGESFESGPFVPTGSVHAIGDAGTNNSCLFVEG